MSEERERRRFGVRRSGGEVMGIALGHLDPDNEDARYFLILAEHPELAKAIEDGQEEVELHGQIVSPTLHLTMHEVVAHQLWEDDPPQTWETAKRLMGLGYGRHDVLHMLGSVVSAAVWDAVNEDREFDPSAFVADLERLPESWEQLRGGP
jgi:hypothetical protein